MTQVALGSVVQNSAVIANGQTASDAIATNGSSLVGIQLPAAFTSTQITFEAATTESGTYQPMYNSAGQVSYTVAQGQYIAIKPEDFYGVQFFKIVAGTSEAAARTLVCSLKGI